ncbi:hypothetical protein EJ08DRAFT_699842 [Tothia fuscella]|uniref:Uncharacterized protein n=1 Tax=Tothia fuscella TaxID=1048955 RepID=A0A9P4NLJ1_9PEZI|nr:hypothetical protein EJ08DRAFT_699842 [Tothia fuscella]
MDAAPLNIAYGHARRAVVEADKGHAQVASKEHELAAGEFSKARDGTQDLEAIRILELLQDHHRQLAAAIQLQQSRSAPKSSSSTKEGEDLKSITPSESQPSQPQAATTRSSTSPVRTRRNPHRDLSSSIASNLARQRRGLPATPELNTQQVGGKILSHIDRPGYNRQLSPERTRKQPKPAEAKDATLTPVAPARRNSDSFATFYGAFETVFSKLSAPLAFAGLPLTAEQALAENAKATAQKEKTRAPSSDEPDLTSIYSKAAMKAIREDAGPLFGPQESFYLVPPTGGTLSYAGMVSGQRDPRNPAHIPETIDEDADEFVDARENLGPPSPRSLRGSKKGASPSISRGESMRKSGFGKTQEELELEVKMLRKSLDIYAQRVQMWEMSAQSQSMALQQSIRAARPTPSLPATVSDPRSIDTASSADGNDKIKELEEMLQREREEREMLVGKNEKIAKENEKLHANIGRYREKWEQLKAGARRRERTTPGGAGGRPETIGEASDEL